MHEAAAATSCRTSRRVLSSLPPVERVRDEVRKASLEMQLLVDLLAVCEKLASNRPRSSRHAAAAPHRGRARS